MTRPGAATYQGVIPGLELDKLINRRGPDWWESAIRKGSRISLLAFGDKVAGYANYGRNRARSLFYDGEIYELYLRPEYQGLGFGRRLFTAARRDLAQSGLKSLVVWALSDNEPAVGFYRTLGGKAVARSSERFGERVSTRSPSPGTAEFAIALVGSKARHRRVFCCAGRIASPTTAGAGNPAMRAGRAHGVDHQAGDRHRPDAARHRRDRAGHLRRLGEGDVADDPRLAVRRRHAVDADVDHGRARLDPVAAHHLRPADRRKQQVGAPADRRQVAGLANARW